VRHFLLFLDRVYDALHRALEERCDIFPRELQLTESDVAARVIVAGRAKLDVLNLTSVAESDLRGLVKTANNVIQIVDEVGFREIFCERASEIARVTRLSEKMTITYSRGTFVHGY
jgi:hypothetical protein